uniref:TonB-dependent receptor n=1 Tax=Trichocoleus desertorum TaxID=1481672 RepID=UPI0025B3CF7F|nr:TonB-dependent receptor [Trichocoleus desertorum]
MRGTAFSGQAIARLCLLTTTVGAMGVITAAHAAETSAPSASDTPTTPQVSEQLTEDIAEVAVQSTTPSLFNPEKNNLFQGETTKFTVVNDPSSLAVLKADPSSFVLLNEGDRPSAPDATVAPPSTNASSSATNHPIQVSQGEPQPENTIPASTETTPVPTTETTLDTTLDATLGPTITRLEILPADDPRVAADGRSTVTLQGRIIDQNEQLIAEDTVVTLTASAGNFVGADYDSDRPGFQVLARQGQFTAQLQATLEAQKVRVRAAVNRAKPTELSPKIPPVESRQPLLSKGELEAYTQVEFITNLRPSLVTGSINLRLGQSGTDFYSSFRDFLDPELIDDGTQFDVDASVFAIGAIGDWLFTGAYNSQRPLNETCDGTTRLFRDIQFCDQNYPVYGDSSTSTYLTPSIDSVYLRFERTSPVEGAEADYGMWGDYNTQEFARSSQLFTATTRQLHGFKGNYNLGNLQATFLYANNVEGFQRDTIAPDGTSGYYFVSRRLVIPGSENVFLETEEIARPGTVVERKSLSRGPDYEIDYDRGTILFRRPILATEFDPFGRTLVRRIVVTYQHETTGNDTNLYGGRLQYNFSRSLNSESWAGVSYLREDQGSQDFELYGVDFLFPLGGDSRLVGEFAQSSFDSLFRGNVAGSAYRLELSAKLSSGILGQAYYRSVDEGFNNNATFSFTPGQTRYGGAIAANVTPTTKLNLQYDRETNYGIAPLLRTTLPDLFNPAPEPIPGSAVDNTLRTISAGVQQKIGTVDLSVDWVNRDRSDRANPELFEGNTNQLVSRLGLPLTESLTFRAQNELNLQGSDPLYPDRTTLGLDWAAYPGVTVRLAQQFISGGLFGNGSITSLDTILEHHFSENTSVTGRYSVLSGFNSMTGQGAVGLNHRWTIAPGLRMSLNYEHIFSNLFLRTAAGQQFAQPYATGQSAAALGLLSGDSYGVGLEYTDNPNFKASARFEHRTSSAGSNTVISAAAAGKVSPAVTALARYQQASASNQLLTALGDTSNLRLGLAYRNPHSDRFNALLRYEYRFNPAITPDTLLFDRATEAVDHTFALEAIYAPDWRWEFYGKYALRNSTSYRAQDLSNTNTISLAQLRTTYRLGYRMDLVGEMRWISQPTTGFDELGWVVETGYYLTPNLRLAAGYSFGRVDDRDFNGDRSKGGLYLGLNLKLNELFDGFGLQKTVPPQQQESQVKPVASQPGLPTSSNPSPGSSALTNSPSVLPAIAGTAP